MVNVPPVYSKKRTDKTTRRLVLNSIQHERLKDQKHVVHSRIGRSNELIESVRESVDQSAQESYCHDAQQYGVYGTNLRCIWTKDWSLFPREGKFTKRILPTERPRRFGQTVVHTVCLIME